MSKNTATENDEWEERRCLSDLCFTFRHIINIRGQKLISADQNNKVLEEFKDCNRCRATSHSSQQSVHLDKGASQPEQHQSYGPLLVCAALRIALMTLHFEKFCPKQTMKSIRTSICVGGQAKQARGTTQRRKRSRAASLWKSSDIWCISSLQESVHSKLNRDFGALSISEIRPS